METLFSDNKDNEVFVKASGIIEDSFFKPSWIDSTEFSVSYTVDVERINKSPFKLEFEFSMDQMTAEKCKAKVVGKRCFLILSKLRFHVCIEIC